MELEKDCQAETSDTKMMDIEPVKNTTSQPELSAVGYFGLLNDDEFGMILPYLDLDDKKNLKLVSRVYLILAAEN